MDYYYYNHYMPFVRYYPGEPILEETFTHSPILIIL